MGKEDTILDIRHKVRLKNLKDKAEEVKELMVIQEDYICYLEKEIEKLSGMDIKQYTKDNPRS